MDEYGNYHACDDCDEVDGDAWHNCDVCGKWHRPPTLEETEEMECGILAEMAAAGETTTTTGEGEE